MRACERCHARKTKCDRRMPSCTSCTKGQVACQYPNKWRDRQLRQEYMKSMERRLRELEDENARLRDGVAPVDTPMTNGVHETSSNGHGMDAGPGSGGAITDAEHEAALVMAMAAAGTDFGPPRLLTGTHGLSGNALPSSHSPAPSASRSPSIAQQPTSQTQTPSNLTSPTQQPTATVSDLATPSIQPASLTLQASLPPTQQPLGPPPPPQPHPPIVNRLSPTQSASSHRTPGEEARYLGSSNGVEFTDVVERVVDGSHDGGDGVDKTMHGVNGGLGGVFGRVSENRRGYSYGYGDSTASDQASDGNDRLAMPHAGSTPATLVDEAIAMPLIESYFAHWHLTFPLLHQPMFLKMVSELYADPRRYQQDGANAFAFDIVLALGAVPAKRHLEWGLGFGDAERHFVRALARLDSVAALRDIRALQALLLYCKYGIHASLRDTSSELWEALGQATQLVVELGLHQTSAVGPTGAAAARLQQRCEVHITGSLPSAIRIEMQRRSFWCYYNLETIVNISLGRPLAIHDDDIDVPLPSAANDDDIGEEAPSTTASGAASEEATSPTSLFLHHILYRRLQARIHRCMYTSRSVQTQPLHERRAQRRAIYRSLHEWQRGIEKLNLQEHHRADQPTRSSFLHPSWYQALYHSACLMLFRPSTAFPALEKVYETTGDDDEAGGDGAGTDNDDPLHILWTSSRGVLQRYGELLRARQFNYSWVTLYTIFMAGLANVYAVGCCAQRRKRWCRQAHQVGRETAASSGTSTPSSPFMPALLDVVCDFRDCSNILTAIGERWNDARAPYDTFARLSMSAMQELAAVTYRPNNSSCVCGRHGTGQQVDGNAAVALAGNEQLTPPPSLYQQQQLHPPQQLQHQQQQFALPFTPIVQDGYGPSGVVPSPGFSAMYGMPMDDTFTPDHALADYYSMVDFQQLFHEM
ncbi:Rac GTPase-activating protein BCR/ABR [Sporothrix curviconia]|uniref:Rac GTPase-activating protein BCR/ABR n=1 Tax=Sporothrix curviconia TaxID=1260050 RepID=A0ABP0CI46_9PEZI